MKGSCDWVFNLMLSPPRKMEAKEIHSKPLLSIVASQGHEVQKDQDLLYSSPPKVRMFAEEVELAAGHGVH